MSHSSPTEDDLSARRHDDLGRDIELLLERLAASREAIVRLLAAGSGGEETAATEASGDEETVAEEGWTDDETVAEGLRQDDETRYKDPSPVGTVRPLRSAIARHAEAEAAPPPEPEATPPQVVVAEAPQPEPQPAADGASYQLPSSLRRPGPPALELALIYREIARKGEEVHPGAAPAAVVYQPEPEGPLAEPPGTAPAPEPSVAIPIVKIPAVRGAPVSVKPLRVKKTDKGPRALNAPRAARRLLAVVLTAVGAVVLLTTIVSLLPSIVSAL